MGTPVTCGTCHRGHKMPEAFVIPHEERRSGRATAGAMPSGAMPPAGHHHRLRINHGHEHELKRGPAMICWAVVLLATGIDWPDMRLFIGIPLADTLVRELATVVSRFRSQADKLRWTATRILAHYPAVPR